MVKDRDDCCADLGMAGKSVLYDIHIRESKSSRNAIGQLSSDGILLLNTRTLCDKSFEGSSLVGVELPGGVAGAEDG